MKVEEIEHRIKEYKKQGKTLFVTSSFQSHSIVLLHVLSKIDNSIPVIFINTGYHFPETIKFRDEVTKLLNLNLIDLKSLTPRNMQKDYRGRLLFTSDPDHCCYLNKTQPLEQLLIKHDIWINGVRADQSAARKAMQVEQAAPHGATRFHPMLDWVPKMIFDYQKQHDLPKHPLESSNYMSIGCEPCTRKINPDMQEREARWYGLNKTECGLHTDLASSG